ncbi:siderophore-interacting protein [Kineococcus gynurae]|uniref:Siderophore-interacting protein n=1 Tax=Kineococcus gynurae TaxID=452979 RepID=A0ABV5LRY9_9ACTN
MTILDAAPVAATDPDWRLFAATVLARRVLSPDLVRITFTDPDLGRFGAGGADQRFKILLPRPGLDVDEIVAAGGGDWHPWWRHLPDALRPVMRTYTVRAFRPATAGRDAELDVDFVLHGIGEGAGATGDCGPAAAWAAAAVPGDRLVLVGPGNPGTGRPWGVEFAPPAGMRRLLLAADETALPAVAAILTARAWGAGVAVTVVLEVPDRADAAALDAPTGSEDELIVLARNASGPPLAHGELLLDAVRGLAASWCPADAAERSGTGTTQGGGETDGGSAVEDMVWDVPDVATPTGTEGVYAWLAGEAGVVRSLRRLLVTDLGVPRDAVAFMGYWRIGAREG